MILGSLAEVTAPKECVTQPLVRRIEVGMVGEIEKLRPELQVDLLGECDVSLRTPRSIPIVPGPWITERPAVPYRMGICLTRQSVLKNLSTVCSPRGRSGSQTRSGRNA